jgi:cell division protein FtsB
MAKKVKIGGIIGKLFEDASLLFWRALTIVVTVLTLFIIGKSVISIVKSKRHINRLERQKSDYLQKIAADSTMLEQLKSDEFLEKFARERYNMQRKDERIYIIEK